ncbi:MAG: NAD(P)H-dependent oxidoreductase [Firmicutes bacterium]|nr:NAD(P)H-dependent oxidoreductase [Bacillota bacterium]
MEKIYDAIVSFDQIVVASPIYYYTFPSPLKVVIDRLQPYWYVPHKNREKKCYLITTCGSGDNFGVEVVLKQTKAFCSLIGFKLVESMHVLDTDENKLPS